MQTNRVLLTEYDHKLLKIQTGVSVARRVGWLGAKQRTIYWKQRILSSNVAFYTIQLCSWVQIPHKPEFFFSGIIFITALVVFRYCGDRFHIHVFIIYSRLDKIFIEIINTGRNKFISLLYCTTRPILP